MPGFTKLYESIIRSSVWSEDDKTRIMWITMLASADQTGHVTGSIPGMAAISRMSVAEAETAIDKLLAPDPYSQTPDKQGARLTIADGGWDVVNHRKYREGRDLEKRREQNRKAQNKFRSKPKVSQSKPQSAQAEAEAEAEAVKKKHCAKLAPFEDFWKVYPNRRGKADALKWWKRNKPEQHLLDTMLSAVHAQESERAAFAVVGMFHAEWPMGSTWLNGKRWEDDVATPAVAKSIDAQKITMYPLKPPKNCSEHGCHVPAVHKRSGAYDFWYCKVHIPEKDKVALQAQGYDV